MSVAEIHFTDEEISQILANERDLRPEARLADYYKLLNQACFGPTHIIPDPERIAENIKAELETLPDEEQIPLQDIGLSRGFCRLYLNILSRDIPDNELNDKIKALSSAIMGSRLSGGIDQGIWHNIWRKNLSLVLEYTDPAADELDLMDHCLHTGSLPSHSDIYRQAYAPHYRVVHSSMITALRAAGIKI